MKIATIVPTAYLDLVQNDDCHLCLAQLIGKDKEYTTFYERAANAGKFVILDNGAAEGYMPKIEALCEKALALKASELVLPDKFFDTKKTLEATHDAIDFLVGESYGGRLMAVPQGRTLKEWFKCAVEMLRWPVDTIGIPKNLVSIDGPFARVKAVSGLRDFADVSRQFDIHLLGCWEDPREVGLVFKNTEDVRSVDSRMAYLYASQRLLLNPKLYAKPQKKDIDFSDNSTSKELLSTNIERWRGYCYGKLR